MLQGAAERALLAVLEFCPVVLQLGDPGEEGHLPEQGFLFRPVFPEQAAVQQVLQRFLLPAQFLRCGLQDPPAGAGTLPTFLKHGFRLPEGFLYRLQGGLPIGHILLAGNQGVHLFLHSRQTARQPFIPPVLLQPAFGYFQPFRLTGEKPQFFIPAFPGFVQVPAVLPAFLIHVRKGVPAVRKPLVKGPDLRYQRGGTVQLFLRPDGPQLRFEQGLGPLPGPGFQFGEVLLLRFQGFRIVGLLLPQSLEGGMGSFKGGCPHGPAELFQVRFKGGPFTLQLSLFLRQAGDLLFQPLQGR